MPSWAPACVTSGNTLNVSVRDVGAGAFAQDYGGTRTFTSFDPAFTGGVRVALGNISGLTVGADVIVSFPQDRTFTFQSPVFASQQVQFTMGDGSVRTAVLGSINYRFSGLGTR